MKINNLTILFGLGLIIIMYIILSYYTSFDNKSYNTPDEYNNGIFSVFQNGSTITEGARSRRRWFRPRRWRWVRPRRSVSRRFRPRRPVIRRVPPPPPPPNYANQINNTVAQINQIKNNINDQKRIFRQDINIDNAITAKANDVKTRVTKINPSLNVTPIIPITKTSNNDNRQNREKIAQTNNTVNSISQQVNTVRRIPTTNYNAVISSNNVLQNARNAQRIQARLIGTPAPVKSDNNLPNVVTTNYGIPKNSEVVKVGFQTIEGLEVSTSNVVDVVSSIENNIKLFEKYGIFIDRNSYDILNREMIKYKNERFGRARITNLTFIRQFIFPLKRNGIIKIQILVDTINTLRKYGYNSNRSIYFYIRRFNALNIYFNKPIFAANLKVYDSYRIDGNKIIDNLETFLNNCLYLKTFDNKDGSEGEFSYSYFMTKHKEWGITTTRIFDNYVRLLRRFYSPLKWRNKNDQGMIKANKAKYLLFIDTINAFRSSNTNKNITKRDNKIHEFFKTLKNVGVRTYEEYISLFEYKNPNLTMIQCDNNITVKISSMDMYTFITYFKKYYNEYRYPSQPTAKITAEDIAKFAENNPRIVEHTIPTRSLITAVSIFITTFKDLQFTTNGCFGYFINSILSGNKYMINLLPYNPLDTSNPILFKFYIETPIQKNGFTTLDSSVSDYYYELIRQIFEPITQLFSSPYKESYTETEQTTIGYSNALKSLGVTDLLNIQISSTETITDRDFLVRLSETIRSTGSNTKPLTMEKATELLNFFSSIQLPIIKIDGVLKSIREFGVSPENLNEFTKQVSYFKVGSSDNFAILLDLFVKLNVRMETLTSFITDLTDFGFTPKNDPESRMVEYLFFTLRILIKYDITYTNRYDTCNTKFSNCLYNLSLDGITLPFFGNAQNNFAVNLLSKLNRNVDLFNSTDTTVVDKTQLNKNMRDLIIRRNNFFYNSSDTSLFGKCYNTSIDGGLVPPETLSSFPTDLYSQLFKRSSLPRFMYEVDEYDPTKKTPLFNKEPVIQIAPNKNPRLYKKQLFYTHIIAQIPYGNLNKTIPFPFDYCEIANLLTVKEYNQMLQKEGSVLMIRSVMSRLLNKLLVKQYDYKNIIKTPDGNNGFTINKNAIVKYNDLVDTINMISIFPHYSFYVISKHIRENNPRKTDDRKCGNPHYRSFDKLISPYVVELSVQKTGNPSKYSYYEKNIDTPK